MFNLFFFIILIVAIVLRILFLDKPSGLWYDELIMYNHACLPSLDIIKYVLNNDMHFPLYQMILRCWMLLFGNSDFNLRFLSLLFGLFSCIGAYFISNDPKKNLLCMLLFSINSFLIYNSQDVKIYSLLVFFVVLNLIFLIRIYEKNKGYIFWIISSLGLIFTYPTAFLYVVFEIILFSFYKFSKKFLLSILPIFLIFIPIIFIVLKNFGRYSNNPNWFYTDDESFLIIFQNFFTPVLTSLDTNMVGYVDNLIKNLNFYSFIFIILPILVAIFFVIKSLKKDNINKIIFLSAVFFYLTYFLVFKIYDINILSRYLIIILPNFLIVIARGFDFKKKSIILMSCFVLINVYYLCFNESAAFKISRLGFKPVAEIINQNAEKEDVIIFRNNIEVIDKYLTKKLKKVSLLQDFAYKSEFFVNNDSNINKLSSKEKKYYIKPYLLDENNPKNILVMYGLMYVLMEKNSRLFLVVEKQFDKYDRKLFFETISDDKLYDGISFNNLLTIKTLLYIKELNNKNLKFINKFYAGDFVVYEYQKI